MVRLVPGSAPSLSIQRGLRAQNFGICPSSSSRALIRTFASPASDSLFKPLDTFERRHVGPDANEVNKMLDNLGYRTMEDFINDAVPQKIRIASNTVNDDSIPPYSESELLKRARDLAKVNKPFRSYIGMGYWNAVVPPVILRNVCTSFYSFYPFAYPILRSWKTRLGILNTRPTSQRLLKVCSHARVVIPPSNGPDRSLGVPRQLSNNGHLPHRHAYCKRIPS